MKVLFKNMVQGYTGKADDSIIYYSRRLNRCLVRRKPRFKKTHPCHQPFREIMSNLARVQPSDAYKEDMSLYLELYNQLKHNRFTPAICWNNIYVKVMFAMAKQDPDIDLSTITRDDIISRELPCMSVNRAIDAGLIPEVKNYKRFSNCI